MYTWQSLHLLKEQQRTLCCVHAVHVPFRTVHYVDGLVMSGERLTRQVWGHKELASAVGEGSLGIKQIPVQTLVTSTGGATIVERVTLP